MITISQLTREYEYFEKKEGFKNSIKTLFKREVKQKIAVNKFDLKVNKGDIIGLIGPNGAGKTTLIKMMTGIIKPTSGKVIVDGFIPSKLKDEYKKEFSVVMGQKSQLWWDLPAMDSFRLHQHIYSINKLEFTKRMDSLIKLFDVEDLIFVQVRKLSLGERMKMELILSLLHNPKILYLDEPTIGLDMITQKKMQQFLLKINKEDDVTIVLTSHYMGDILTLCNRVAVINNGKKVYDECIENIDEKAFTQQMEALYEGSGDEFVEDDKFIHGDEHE